MTDQSPNPYAPTHFVAESDPYATGPDMPPLAGRAERFVASLMDGMLLAAFILPLGFLAVFNAPAPGSGPGPAFTDSIWIEMFMTILWPAAYLLVNGYTLVTRGQSLGKMVMKVQIVDFESDQLLGFVRVALIRNCWALPLSIAAVLIPSDLDDQIIGLITLVSILMIFRQDRRCLHDLLAGSRVVIYRANRNRVCNFLP